MLSFVKRTGGTSSLYSYQVAAAAVLILAAGSRSAPNQLGFKCEMCQQIKHIHKEFTINAFATNQFGRLSFQS